MPVAGLQVYAWWEALTTEDSCENHMNLETNLMARCLRCCRPLPQAPLLPTAGMPVVGQNKLLEHTGLNNALGNAQ